MIRSIVFTPSNFSVVFQSYLICVWFAHHSLQIVELVLFLLVISYHLCSCSRIFITCHLQTTHTLFKYHLQITEGSLYITHIHTKYRALTLNIKLIMLPTHLQISLMSPGCHLGVTWMSPWCHLDVTWMSLWCHLGVTLMSPQCHLDVTLMSLGCHLDVTLVSPRCHLSVTLVSPSFHAEDILVSFTRFICS